MGNFENYLSSKKSQEILAIYRGDISYDPQLDPESPEFIGARSAYHNYRAFKEGMLGYKTYLYGLWNAGIGGQCFTYLNDAHSWATTGEELTDGRNWATT